MITLLKQYTLHILLAAVFVSALFFVPVHAATTGGGLILGGAEDTASAGGIDTSGPDVQTIVGGIISTALTYVGVLFFLLMIYGGITWMLARGNEEYSKRALNTIVAAIIGLIVIVASYAITQFVFDSIEDQSSTPDSLVCCVITNRTTNARRNEVNTLSACRALGATENIVVAAIPDGQEPAQYCASVSP